MNALVKFWPTIFAIANVMAVYKLFSKYDDIVFNTTLILGVILIIYKLGVAFSKQSFTKYKFIYIYILILWGYQLTFGMGHIHPKTWSYLFAKTEILLLIIITIECFPQYYVEKFILFISYITCILITFGAFTYPWSLDGRIGLGFGNPNQMASLCALCICFIIQLKKNTIKRNRKILLISVLIIGVLLSGSRAALGLIIMALIYKYRFNIKLILLVGFTWFIVFNVLPSYNVSFEGINRLMDTVESQDFSKGRKRERQAAWVMIESNPIEGNGIYCVQTEDVKQISELGSHNAYLDFLKWFGYPMGIILIASLLLCSFSLALRYWECPNFALRGHLMIVLGVVIISVFEGLIWGVNEIDNTIFFISFAVLCRYKPLQQTTLKS